MSLLFCGCYQSEWSHTSEKQTRSSQLFSSIIYHQRNADHKFPQDQLAVKKTPTTNNKTKSALNKHNPHGACEARSAAPESARLTNDVVPWWVLLLAFLKQLLN